MMREKVGLVTDDVGEMVGVCTGEGLQQSVNILSILEIINYKNITFSLCLHIFYQLLYTITLLSGQTERHNARVVAL